jgi:hypothetical protein
MYPGMRFYGMGGGGFSGANAGAGAQSFGQVIFFKSFINWNKNFLAQGGGYPGGGQYPGGQGPRPGGIQRQRPVGQGGRRPLNPVRPIGQPGPGGRRVGPNGKPLVKRPLGSQGNQFGRRRDEEDNNEEEINQEEGDYFYEDEVADYDNQHNEENQGHDQGINESQFYDT